MHKGFQLYERLHKKPEATWMSEKEEKKVTLSSTITPTSKRLNKALLRYSKNNPPKKQKEGKKQNWVQKKPIGKNTWRVFGAGILECLFVAPRSEKVVVHRGKWDNLVIRVYHKLVVMGVFSSSLFEAYFLEYKSSAECPKMFDYFCNSRRALNQQKHAYIWRRY